MIDDAISDAQYLRATIQPAISTTKRALQEVAEVILDWLDTTQSRRPTVMG
jgi:hypothetical protein